MKYIVLSCEMLSDLVLEVNAEIIDGWKPLGGVAVSACDSDGVIYSEYCQAMIQE